MADQIGLTLKNYRVVYRPPTTQYGDTVFLQEWTGADWKDVRSFNTLSDDYAHTNAREDAQRRQKAHDRRGAA